MAIFFAACKRKITCCFVFAEMQMRFRLNKPWNRTNPKQKVCKNKYIRIIVVRINGGYRKNKQHENKVYGRKDVVNY
ncbi:MAG: hypothetical protein COB24_06555 [Hyphomicrobiales bacterium]|nr:MAG: hypothetical protein COB24_06555 [Hyphomicrobiales bacterium]